MIQLDRAPGSSLESIYIHMYIDEQWRPIETTVSKRTHTNTQTRRCIHGGVIPPMIAPPSLLKRYLEWFFSLSLLECNDLHLVG